MAKTIKMTDAPSASSSTASSSSSSGDDEFNNNSILITEEDVDIVNMALAHADNFDMTFAPGVDSVTFVDPNVTFNPNLTRSRVTINEGANKTFGPSGACANPDVDPNKTFFDPMMVSGSPATGTWNQLYRQPMSANNGDERGFENGETPKFSKKRKRATEVSMSQHKQGTPELANLVTLFVSPSMPDDAKIGLLQSINALLSSNNGHAIFLARDDFCLELGKLLSSRIGNDEGGSLSIIVCILEKMSTLPPKDREVLNKCCHAPLKKLTAHIDVVSKANEVLGRLHI